MEDVEDAYTFYVLIVGLPEHIFWEMELSSLLSVAGNKLAFDGYMAAEQTRAWGEKR